MSKNFLSKAKSMLIGSEPKPALVTEHPITLRSETVTTPSIHMLDGREQKEGYLAGQLLVATPLIDSGPFQRSVVFVFAHGADGAMGVIVNQPLELVHFSSLIEGFKLPEGAENKEIPVYYGGPVERSRGFVIHTNDFIKDYTLAVHRDVSVTASSAILNDILAGNGPRKSALVVGYAGWSQGQLEQEIEQNSWIVVPSSPELIFDTEDDIKWATASKSLGVDMAFFSTIVGHA
ncbi:MAG: YqgE/AlgH family protein [Alphaproteobacteria bacterium]|nr:YqgE/AlgH family protein [Alphaproteobacteria bacterium]